MPSGVVTTNKVLVALAGPTIDKSTVERRFNTLFSSRRIDFEPTYNAAPSQLRKHSSMPYLRAREHAGPAGARKDGRSRLPAGERGSAERVPALAPVVVATCAAAPPSPAAAPSSPSVIEIAIGDVVVRVSGPVEATLITTVLRALRRAS